MRSTFTITLLILIAPWIVGQDKRLAPVVGMGQKKALVIGNGSYSIGALSNPVHDSSSVRKALAAKGFKIWTCCDNADQQTLEKTIDDWTESLNRGDIAVFYYSGHGLRINYSDYIVPIDFKKTYTQADVRYKAYPLERVRDKIQERGARVSLIIVDACRSNPFTLGNKDWSQGLAALTAGFGTVIFFAAEEGMKADDNESENNSLFTAVLLEELKQPEISVKKLTDEVRAEVFNRSKGKQIPYASDGLIFDYVLGNDAQNRKPPAPPEPINATSAAKVTSADSGAKSSGVGSSSQGQTASLVAGNDDAVCKALGVFVESAAVDFSSLKGPLKEVLAGDPSRVHSGAQIFIAITDIPGFDCNIWVFEDVSVHPTAICKAKTPALEDFRKSTSACFSQGLTSSTRSDGWLEFDGPNDLKIIYRSDDNEVWISY